MPQALAAAAFALVASGTLVQEAARGALEDELLRLETARSEALGTGDLKALDDIYADDFTGVAGTGQLVTKAQLFEFIRKTDPSVRFTSSEVSARVFGETGIVVGRLAARRDDGSLVSEVRFTHVFVRRAGRFKFVADQSTPILATPDPLPARLPPAERQTPRASHEPYADSAIGITPPHKTYDVTPQWLGHPGPRQAHATVQLVIRRDGGVAVEQVWSATDFEWGEACRQAVSQWRYEPARKDGLAVAVRTTVSCALNVP